MIYPYLHQLFSDKKGQAVFTCFGPWHFLFLLVLLSCVLLGIMYFKRHPGAGKKIVGAAINLAFGLYVADFFLMPFAYGKIDMEKLPFHMCTLMSILCFLSFHGIALERYKKQFAMLGLVSNLIYVLCPAGVEWYQIHPLSYRVVQTLAFHGAMSVYGIFSLAMGEIKLSWKNCRQELPVIAAVVLWALLGNLLYNGTAGDYSNFFNWFFVVRDPFYILHAEIAPYVMPFIMLIVIFVADMLLYLFYFAVQKIIGYKKIVTSF